MKRILIGWISIVLVAAPMAAMAAVQPGSPAPDFSLQAADGKTYHLADYRGKYVVLEWYNTGCPFIAKHYNSGNMQRLQQRYTSKGVVWLTIASSAPGKQGYMKAEEAQADRKRRGSRSTATLLDPDNKVASSYEAKTTPHMFVIDPKGDVIYNGAIDDRNSTDLEDVKGAKNYVAAALDEAMAGKPVTLPETKPYGCSVKYKS